MGRPATSAPKQPFDPEVEAVRRFNRFYTWQIGVLGKGLLGSQFSLTEVRVLYEIAHRKDPTATELGRDLSLDEGYLSRILRGFERRGLLRRTRSKTDNRQSFLALTKHGRAVFEPLDQRSHDEVASMLVKLSGPDRGKLVAAMRLIETVLGGGPTSPEPYRLRTHRSGDMGWVAHRHGILYKEEYGWDERFEALVSEIVSKFIQEFDPKRERCWIAEKDGEIVGSVFLVKESATVAKLRLLLVEPSARGLGIGARLITECIRFARRAGYRKITLWTNDVLSAARRLYEKAGFRVVASERHSSFGHDLVGETWEFAL